MTMFALGLRVLSRGGQDLSDILEYSSGIGRSVCCARGKPTFNLANRRCSGIK